MKDYTITLPDRLNSKTEEIIEFILANHYQNAIFGPGFCAHILGIDKYSFQNEILGKFNIELNKKKLKRQR